MTYKLVEYKNGFAIVDDTGYTHSYSKNKFIALCKIGELRSK